VVGLNGLGYVALVEINLSAAKPTKIPTILKTWGDHIKKRRLQLNLSQEDLAMQLGVGLGAVRRWEWNLNQPRPMHIPGIISFLGFVPQLIPQGTIGERIKAYRLLRGLSSERMSRILRCETSLLRKWEKGTATPTGDRRLRIEGMLE
jgi:DNA-binding transcriptional regulator YiaG